MSDDSGKFEKLEKLLGMTRSSDAQGALTAQALLSNVNVGEWLDANAKQNQAVINAYWKSQCGENYVAPEVDDVGSNFVNCSIVSDKAISQLAAAIGDEVPPVQPPTEPPPTEPPQPERPPRRPVPWWAVVLLTLASVAFGALLVWLSWRAFSNPPDSYELIVEPFEPPTLMEFEK